MLSGTYRRSWACAASAGRLRLQENPPGRPRKASLRDVRPSGTDSSPSNGPSRRGASDDDEWKAQTLPPPEPVEAAGPFCVERRDAGSAEHPLVPRRAHCRGSSARRRLLCRAHGTDRPGSAELRGKAAPSFPSSSALGERKRGRAVPRQRERVSELPRRCAETRQER